MAHLNSVRLREDVKLELVYDDQTPWGCGFTGLSDALLRRSCGALEAVVAREGMDALQIQAQRWMPEVMGPRALGSLYTSPERLRETCVYPPASKVRPAALDVFVPHEDGMRTTRLLLCTEQAASLAPWVGAWQRGGARPQHGGAAALWDRLMEAGAFEAPREPVQPLGEGITFVGHAAVAMREADTELLFDPFLLPPSKADPATMRPHTACDLEPSAVFVTHSHPDHFDIPTLLRLGHDTPIYVPAVERESLLATDMVLRLRELGFTAVRSLAWFDEVTVGPYRVVALPFYGEQPTDSHMLHPEARNLGNTYVVEGRDHRVALLADAGRDAAGDTIEMAADARARYGAVDYVFGGYRAWRLQPIRYLFSSVARYLLFVPPEARTRWQTIMNDADDLVATAAAWGARSVVPYANGGAPWFARIRLGPHGNPDRPDDPRIDPSIANVERAIAASEADLELFAMKTGQCAAPARANH
ncbi:MAG: MBL fold metallo-hydrolase [Deltaproteobacteria bacterium]|nr:MBL fold metallo-hydrolase [Deltaproteobacteria bacterium]